MEDNNKKSINIQYETTGSKKGIPFLLLPHDYEKILIMPFIKYKTIQQRSQALGEPVSIFHSIL